jgi:hypothetical protein
MENQKNIIKWQDKTSLIYGNLHRDYRIENKTFSICITDEKCYFLSPEKDYINNTQYTILYEKPLYIYNKGKKGALSVFHKKAVKHIRNIYKGAPVIKEN